MLENREIVCISSVDWEPLLTRKQQVMSRLPVSNRILYVEPPITLLSAFKDKSMWMKWTMWFKGRRRLKENIWLWSPPVTLPFGNKYRWINRFNQWWQSIFLKPVLKEMGFTNPILWTYMPNTADMTNEIDHQVLIYDCVDEHSEYTGLINKQTMLDMEEDLCRACDLVFVTATGLYESKKDWNPQTHYLPNAANVEHFMKAQSPETVIPEDIRGIKGPVIGFVGVIQDWVDQELMYEAAVAHPEWSLVLVGPVGVGIDVSRLSGLPNVHFLGRKKVDDLPGYLKAFDVCLNPFRMNELTRNVSPLKFYEYLASGKPIVTVDMPGIRDFADVVEVVSCREEFTAGIERALEGENEAKRTARLSRARENSWESRVRVMEEKITAYMQKKGLQ
ncbi:MAG TPA: glycosyltransferase [Bacillota bacterium]|nr:glycosyltransferase [Bacillota bacterium]